MRFPTGFSMKVGAWRHVAEGDVNVASCSQTEALKNASVVLGLSLFIVCPSSFALRWWVCSWSGWPPGGNGSAWSPASAWWRGSSGWESSSSSWPSWVCAAPWSTTRCSSSSYPSAETLLWGVCWVLGGCRFHDVAVPQPVPVHGHPLHGVRVAVFHLLCVSGSQHRTAGEFFGFLQINLNSQICSVLWGGTLRYLQGRKLRTHEISVWSSFHLFSKSSQCSFMIFVLSFWGQSAERQ